MRKFCLAMIAILTVSAIYAADSKEQEQEQEREQQVQKREDMERGEREQEKGERKKKMEKKKKPSKAIELNQYGGTTNPQSTQISSETLQQK